MKKLITLSLLLALCTGCATRGSNYVPLVDNKGHDQTQIDNDTAECQAFARQRMDAASGAVVGALVGGLLMAALMPRGYRNQAAAQGVLFGGLGGAAGATETQETIIKRCLQGRGLNVLN